MVICGKIFDRIRPDVEWRRVGWAEYSVPIRFMGVELKLASLDLQTYINGSREMLRSGSGTSVRFRP